MNVCLYSCLTYPVCKSHLFCAALYCHLWLAWALPYFSALSHKQQDFRKKIEHNMYVFLYGFYLKNFSLKNNSGRYYHKCTQLFM
jgi:hypothetical protein